MGPAHARRARRDAPALPGGAAGAGAGPLGASGRSTRTCRPTPSSSSPPAPPPRPRRRKADPGAGAKAVPSTRDGSQAKANVVPNPALAQRPKPVAPTMVQAAPGATTRFITRPADAAGASAVGHAEDRGDARVREPLHPAAASAARRPRPSAPVPLDASPCSARSPRPQRPRRRRPSRQPTAMTPDGGAAAPPRGRRADARRCRGAWPASSTRRCCCSASPWCRRSSAPCSSPRPASAIRCRARASLRAFALVVYGIYFVGCWSVRGQTLAMQTWRIRVVTADGAPAQPGAGAGPLRRLLHRLVRRRRRWSPPPCSCAAWPTLGAVAARDRRLRPARPGRARAAVLARHRLRHAAGGHPRRAGARPDARPRPR